MNQHSSEDYYFNEQGLLVFTEQYLLNRGFCCGNGCKHCPYGNAKKEKNAESSKTFKVANKQQGVN